MIYNYKSSRLNIERESVLSVASECSVFDDLEVCNDTGRAEKSTGALFAGMDL